MATEKELLDAIKVIKNHCETHSVCKECLLRNSYGSCGLFKICPDVEISTPEEWQTRKEELPKLFVY